MRARGVRRGEVCAIHPSERGLTAALSERST